MFNLLINQIWISIFAKSIFIWYKVTSNVPNCVKHSQLIIWTAVWKSSVLVKFSTDLSVSVPVPMCTYVYQYTVYMCTIYMCTYLSIYLSIYLPIYIYIYTQFDCQINYYCLHNYQINYYDFVCVRFEHSVYRESLMISPCSACWAVFGLLIPANA